MKSILHILCVGSENSKTRNDLMREYGNCDRDNRAEIEDLKPEHAIINLGKGYYIPSDADIQSALRYYNQELHRALTILKGLRGLRKWLATRGQISLVEFMRDVVDAAN